MHRPVKRLLCSITFSNLRPILHLRSTKQVFSLIAGPNCFLKSDFGVGPVYGPWRDHRGEPPKQSSSAMIFAVCLGLGLILEVCRPKNLDLQGISPIPYTPLPSPDSFRTLVLLPGRSSQPIRCVLSSVKMSEKLPYDALSYQWGDQTRLKTIYVNDVKVAITENLWLALSSLREAKQPRYLWADAICINQRDDDEKAMQVPKMASIYQRAVSVIIYLGNHTPYNDLHNRSSLDAVESLTKSYIQQSGKSAKDIRQEEVQESTPQNLQDLVNKAIREVKVAEVGMDYFLRNVIHEEYWKRGWIIQEVVMASKGLMVRYGDNSVEWDTFIYWVQGYRQRHPKDDSVKQILHLGELRKLRSSSGSVSTLASLLDAFKDSFTSNCQNEVYHDKVYAFLGLAHDCPSRSFPVSYKKSAAHVYQDCIAYFWENSSLTPKQRSIELVYFSSLIRRLLTRKPELRRQSGRPFGEHPYEATFLLATEDIFKQREQNLPFLESLLQGVVVGTIYGLFMGIIMAIFSCRRTGKEWFWEASKEEELTLWVSKQAKSDTINDLSIRGIVIEKIKHIGLYEAAIPRGSEVTNWSLKDVHPPMQGVDLATQTQTLRQVKSLLRSVRPSAVHSVERILSPAEAFSASNNIESRSGTREEGMLRIFVGSNVSVGIVPSQAQAGDLICRFWNSNTIAVVRMEEHKRNLLSLVRDLIQSKDSRREFKLIGRAIMANEDSSAEDISSRLNGELFGIVDEKAIDVPVSLATLTHLGLNTIFWEGT